MDNPENHNVAFARLVEDQMSGKLHDPRATCTSKLLGPKSGGGADSRLSRNFQQTRSDTGFPPLCQAGTSFAEISIILLQNVGDCRIAEDDPGRLHVRRARSRKAAIKPFFLISEIESSTFGPFDAASSSCSRFANRRSLSCLISSRMYSLGVLQSPDETWPST